MQVAPRGQHVLVKVQDAEEQTMGGILLPESAQTRPTSGRVVSTGDGSLPNGRTMKFLVAAGDEVCSASPSTHTHTHLLWLRC